MCCKRLNRIQSRWWWCHRCTRTQVPKRRQTRRTGAHWVGHPDTLPRTRRRAIYPDEYQRTAGMADTAQDRHENWVSAGILWCTSPEGICHGRLVLGRAWHGWAWPMPCTHQATSSTWTGVLAFQILCRTSRRSATQTQQDEAMQRPAKNDNLSSVFTRMLIYVNVM